MSFSGHCGGYLGSEVTCFGKIGLAGMTSRFTFSPFTSYTYYMHVFDFMTSPSAPSPHFSGDPKTAIFFSFSP